MEDSATLGSDMSAISSLWGGSAEGVPFSFVNFPVPTSLTAFLETKAKTPRDLGQSPYGLFRLGFQEAVRFPPEAYEKAST